MRILIVLSAIAFVALSSSAFAQNVQKNYKLSCAEACAKFCLKSAYRNFCTMRCPYRCEMNRSGMK
jgi:hypothetical protein